LFKTAETFGGQELTTVDVDSAQGVVLKAKEQLEWLCKQKRVMRLRRVEWKPEKR